MEKISVSIRETTNPKIIKFEANAFLTNQESFEFNTIDEAKNSPLAQQLFYLPFVKKIYLSGNFIAIERLEIVEWNEVQNEVAEQIEQYLNQGGVVIESSVPKKKAVTVYAESTPNPAVLKFVANKRLVAQSFEFKTKAEAQSSPLAQELFRYPFVNSVFIDENYVSVTKNDSVEWTEITMELREFIKSYIEQGNTVISVGAAQQSVKQHVSSINFEELDPTSKQIVNILEEYVKPAVASDGGNIIFDSYDPELKKVKVILQGACSGCPSSTFTLKNGIENMLREMLTDKVESVEAING